MFRVSCPSKPWKSSRCQSPNMLRKQTWLLLCNMFLYLPYQHTHMHPIFINPGYLNTKKFIKFLQRGNKSQTAECDLLADYLCCPCQRLNSVKHMHNYQGPPDQYAPVTRYHIVFENPSHLYSRAIYCTLFIMKKERTKKEREKSWESKKIKDGRDGRERRRGTRVRERGEIEER